MHTGEPVFSKLNSSSVVQQIIDAITAAIISGKYKPGDKIPTETELAGSLGVGRNSVREAIKIMVHLGVLEIRRAEGTFVCNGFSGIMIDPMIYGMILDGAHDYGHLMEIRAMMEVGILRLAMNNSRKDDMKRLRERLQDLKREIDKGVDNIDVIFETDNAFHDEVSEMGRNPIAGKLSRIVRVLTWSMRYSSVSNMIKSGRGEELYLAHERIYKILEDHDESHMEEIILGTYFPEEAGDPPRISAEQVIASLKQ